MPDAKKVHDVLAAAGFPQSIYAAQKPGEPARDIAGFKVQTLRMERRALYVFHVGRDERANISRYKKALEAAGYLVNQDRRGLKVENYRTSLDRGKR